MNHRRISCESLAKRCDRGQRFVIDDDRLGGVGGGVTIDGHDHRNNVADEAGNVTGDERHVHAGQTRRTCGQVGNVGGGPNGKHAVHRPRDRCIDCDDTRMRLGAAHHRHEGAARGLEVVDVLTLSGDQIRVFLAQNLCTDQRHVVLSPDSAISQ